MLGKTSNPGPRTGTQAFCFPASFERIRDLWRGQDDGEGELHPLESGSRRVSEGARRLPVLEFKAMAWKGDR